MTNENDWVTQDVVPRRVAIDEYRWILTKTGVASSWGLTRISPKHQEDISHGYIDDHGARLEVRCKRKDHPVLGKADKKPLPCPYCTLKTFKGWHEGKCPYCGRVRGVCSQMVSQDELNAAPRTRAWTFGVPAQTGHFLISFLDPAVTQKDITACTIDKDDDDKPLWFVYLGQTSDFVDPVAQKAKYTLLTDPKEPNGAWLRRPDEIQDALNRGWLFVTEREFEVPEWD